LPRAFLILLALVLAGCADAPTPHDGLPALLFVANPQAGVLVVVGSESSASWDRALLQPSGDPLCGIEAPDSGAMQPGQAIQLRYAGKAWTARSKADALCIVRASYNGTELGTYTFQDPTLAYSKTPTPTPTTSSSATMTTPPPENQTKPTPSPTPTASPPPGNQTPPGGPA